MYGGAASRHSQHRGEEPAGAGTLAPVAAKAAAINAAQAHPLTWKTVVKRALVVAVAGAAIDLALPSLIAVLDAWPRLSTLNPAWFALALVAEPARRRHGRRRRPVQDANRRGVRHRHGRRRAAAAAPVRAARHPGRRADQARAGPYRPARCRPGLSWTQYLA